jgi:sec-independent protein translocase protein TatB
MFDLDFGKMLVFGIVALAVIPPKDLPRVLRTVGKYVGQMRRMASDFQGQFMDALKEADVESVKKEFQSMEAAAKIDTSFDPVSVMRDEMTKATETAAPAAPVVEIPAEATKPDEPFLKEVVAAPLAADPERVGLVEAASEEKAAIGAPAGSAQ